METVFGLALSMWIGGIGVLVFQCVYFLNVGEWVSISTLHAFRLGEYWFHYWKELDDFRDFRRKDDSPLFPDITVSYETVWPWASETEPETWSGTHYILSSLPFSISLFLLGIVTLTLSFIAVVANEKWSNARRSSSKDVELPNLLDSGECIKSTRIRRTKEKWYHWPITGDHIGCVEGLDDGQRDEVEKKLQMVAKYMTIKCCDIILNRTLTQSQYSHLMIPKGAHRVYFGGSYLFEKYGYESNTNKCLLRIDGAVYAIECVNVFKENNGKTNGYMEYSLHINKVNYLIAQKYDDDNENKRKVVVERCHLSEASAKKILQLATLIKYISDVNITKHLRGHNNRQKKKNEQGIRDRLEAFREK